AQHTMQLAYDLLATVEEPWTRGVLENVVLMLWPSLNPDGVQLVSEWYGSNVGTPYEVAPMPWLYQKYIGHDNNRDAYMLNAVETRAIVRTWRDWEPQIIHTHHQSSPFPTRIWLPPFAEPVSSRAPALVSRTINSLGMAMAQALEENGQVGATHMDFFDAWYPGYTDYMPIFQNIAAYWTETALYRYATPRFYTIADFPDYRADLRPEALYSSPWPGGWWRVGDAVAYMVTASKAVLDYAASRKEQVLLNRYRSGADQIAYFRANPPYAYLVPQEQSDPVAAVEMLRRLAFLGIPIQRLGEARSFGDRTYPAGTWVIRTDHEFGETVRVLMEAQEYPDLREYPDGPPAQPYDVAGWTLPALMDVDVAEVAEPLSDQVLSAMTPVETAVGDWRTLAGMDDVTRTVPAIDVRGDGGPLDGSLFDTPRDMGFDTHPVAAAIVPPAGALRGSGSRLAVDPDQNNAFRAINRAWSSGGRVEFRSASDGGPARYLIEVSGREGLVRDLALQAEATSDGASPIARPRIGLYRPWTASMDEGWTRWLFERFDFPFQGIRDADLKAGDLNSRYDVIVLPSERPTVLLEGHAPGSVPARYAGGMGEVGARALGAFVRGGGRLIALNSSADFAIEAMDLPVTNVLSGAERSAFFSTGSLMNVEVDTSHPVMAGVGSEA
ncbi:MAG: M14 family metallopeptidase, partial [Gemmatimonadota bacterium]|nr:M14 family metallopeptidase [Gemmatimonadota bacterium]